MKYLIIPLVSIFLVSFKPIYTAKQGVKKTWLFSKQEFAGIVARDENGKQITKSNWHTHFLYLEVDKQNIATWDSAFYNNNTYQLSSSQVKQTKVEVGKVNDESKLIVIKPKSNCALILIHFQNMDIPMENIEQKIILFGTRKSKKIQLEISKVNINLLPEFRP